MQLASLLIDVLKKGQQVETFQRCNVVTASVFFKTKSDQMKKSTCIVTHGWLSGNLTNIYQPQRLSKENRKKHEKAIGVCFLHLISILSGKA